MHSKPAIPRRSFLRQAVCAPLALAPGRAALAGGERKPNIVVIYTDDQGYGDVGCFGARDAHTPNMDRLAAGGARLDRWYSNAPVCSPSRAALLTGRYPQRVGLPGNAPRGLDDEGMHPSETTLAEALKPLGYATGACGKWHVGSAAGGRPNDQGFDSFYGFLSGCVDYYSHIMYWGQGPNNYPYHDLWRDGEEIWEDGQYMTDRIADESVDFIRRSKDGPFFLYAAFSAPHYPMHAPREYFERFAHIEDPQRRTQLAMVSSLDGAIGRILDELDRLGLAENTIVYFQSDNGPSTEQRNLLDDSNRKYRGGSAGPFRGHKGSLFEGGIRVPAIMRWPGVIPEGRVVRGMGAAMDIFPTFVRLAGGAPPDGRPLDGKDVFPMIAGDAASPHNEPVFWALGKQRAVLEDGWKLILNGRLDFDDSADGQLFLGNLKDDPFETNNLAGSRPELVQSLEKKIEAWERDVFSKG